MLIPLFRIIKCSIYFQRLICPVLYIICPSLEIIISSPLSKLRVIPGIKIFPAILFLRVPETTDKLQILVHLPFHIEIIRNLRVFREVFCP